MSALDTSELVSKQKRKTLCRLWWAIRCSHGTQPPTPRDGFLAGFEAALGAMEIARVVEVSVFPDTEEAIGVTDILLKVKNEGPVLVRAKE